MSCIITAVPFFLLYSVVTAITTKTAQNAIENKVSDQLYSEFYTKYGSKNNMPNLNEEVAKLTRKEHQTMFMDMDLLVKTLQEHGVQDFSIVDDTLSCKIEDFSLRFYKIGDKPYVLEVMHPKNCFADETISDIDTEYAKNAQESTYLKIKERLENEKLQIDSEEIMEDDSIVLTINLD